MQVTVETTSGLERRLTIGVPAERVDSAVAEKLKEATSNVRLPGFRPGKVPMKVMRQRFGQSVRIEVMQEVMGESLNEALTQQDLIPAGQPSVEPKSIDEGKDLEFTATFEVFPEIELGDFTKLSALRPLVDVNDADVDKMIDNLREQSGEEVDVQRAAKDGDKVDIDFKGERDGEAFDGGSAEGQSLTLGSGSMIPGFEDAIVGMSAGDEKDVNLTFPEDYHAEDLKGADVVFHIKLNAVKEKQPAEMNEEFFKRYGVEEGGLDALKEDIKKNLIRDAESSAKQKVKTDLMDGMLKLHDSVQIPAALVAQEIDAMRKQQTQQFGEMAAQLDLKSIFPDEVFKDQAERRVKLGLILNEVVRKEDITADADAVRAAIDKLADGYEDKQGFTNWCYSNQEQLQQIQSMVVEDKVVEHLMTHAKVEGKDMSYDELKNLANQQSTDQEEEAA